MRIDDRDPKFWDIDLTLQELWSELAGHRLTWDVFKSELESLLDIANARLEELERYGNSI